MVSMIGCFDNDTESKPVVDYGGFSKYYIVNHSNLDLKIAYKIAAPTHIGKDSTVSVLSDSTTQIFKYGGRGGNFLPSYVFAKLSFYKSSDGDMNSPLFTVEPIVDDNWDNVTVKDDKAMKYELLITDEDLK
jgi:hypothetical protein